MAKVVINPEMTNDSLLISAPASEKGSVNIFSNPEFGTVRTITINGEIWFVAKDAASILGYENTNKAILDHVDDDDKKMVYMSDLQHHNESLPDNMKRSKVVIINESGLYSLILRSNMPKAKGFKKWVTSEVLPSIRITGSYSVNKPSKMSDEEYNSRMADYNTRLKEAEAKILEVKMKSAELLLSIKDKTTIPEVAKVADSYAMNLLVGKDVIALPEVNEKTYSATDIGKMLGVSSQKIGKLSNKHGMKTEEFGKWFYDKSRYSEKEVETFRYYQKAIDKFKELLNK